MENYNRLSEKHSPHSIPQKCKYLSNLAQGRLQDNKM